MHDVDLAEDAVQGTLLRVFKQWPEARKAPEAYTRVTLANLCRDHWRRLKSRPSEVLSENVATGTPDTSAAFSDAWADRKMLDQALEHLGSPQRDVLVLRFFLELTVAETAAALGIPEGTVKSTTSRGLSQLRDVLLVAEGGEAR